VQPTWKSDAAEAPASSDTGTPAVEIPSESQE